MGKNASIRKYKQFRTTPIYMQFISHIGQGALDCSFYFNPLAVYE